MLNFSMLIVGQTRRDKLWHHMRLFDLHAKLLPTLRSKDKQQTFSRQVEP